MGSPGSELLLEDVKVVVGHPVDAEGVRQTQDQLLPVVSKDRHREDPGGVGLVVQTLSKGFTKLGPVHDPAPR